MAKPSWGNTETGDRVQQGCHGDGRDSALALKALMPRPKCESRPLIGNDIGRDDNAGREKPIGARAEERARIAHL